MRVFRCFIRLQWITFALSCLFTSYKADKAPKQNHQTTRNKRKNTLLWSIPTLTHYSNIVFECVWHIIWKYLWHICMFIFIFWHSIWHSFWHSIWHIFLTCFLASMLTFSLTCFLAFFVANRVRVQTCPAAPRAGRGGVDGWGDEGIAPLSKLKSRDPHLAGGEHTKNKKPKIK